MGSASVGSRAAWTGAVKEGSSRELVDELSPGAAHYLDWFHIAMRLTGLGQYAKGLTHHNPVAAVALQSRLERIKWRLWHGDAGEALTCAEQIAEAVVALDSAYSSMKRFAKAAAGLATYIANNADAITNYSARWHNGERISTAFVESTVNVVVSRRFAKKQQMLWSKTGAHRLLQTRTRALDGTLHDLFATWYPAMAANDTQGAAPVAAAQSSPTVWHAPLSYPLSECLRRAADLGRDRANRGPLRGVIAPMLQYHPHCPLPHLR